ncbi:MAG: hypothetical protein HGA85_02560 [Nanoarchaeota archaeon]|nr:hypothetical protein [Nanoarchaeota archaeon]
MDELVASPLFERAKSIAQDAPGRIRSAYKGISIVLGAYQASDNLSASEDIADINKIIVGLPSLFQSYESLFTFVKAANPRVHPMEFSSYKKPDEIIHSIESLVDDLVAEINTGSDSIQDEQAKKVSENIFGMHKGFVKLQTYLEHRNIDLQKAYERATIGRRGKDPGDTFPYQVAAVLGKPFSYAVAFPKKAALYTTLVAAAALAVFVAFNAPTWYNDYNVKRAAAESAYATQMAATQRAQATQTAFALTATADAQKILDARRAELQPYYFAMDQSIEAAKLARTQRGQIFTDQELAGVADPVYAALENAVRTGVYTNLDSQVKTAQASIDQFATSDTYQIDRTWNTVFFQVYSSNPNSLSGLADTTKFGGAFSNNGTIGVYGDDTSIILIEDENALGRIVREDFLAECTGAYAGSMSCVGQDGPANWDSTIYRRQDGNYVVGLAGKPNSGEVTAYLLVDDGNPDISSFNVDQAIEMINMGQRPGY